MSRPPLDPRATVQALNRAWRDRDWQAAVSLLHPNAVFVGPDGNRTVGAEACVASYREFVEHATVEEYEVTDPQVDVIGEVAVVRYRYEITYRWQGNAVIDSGLDLFVVTLVDGRWLVTWRMLSVDPPLP